MTNNTEQRRAFEEGFQMPPSIFWDGEQYSTLRSDTGALRDSLTHQGRWEGWQAALAQREQEAPSLCTAEGFLSKDTPKTFVPCTPEEAAELARNIIGRGWECLPMEASELAAIINADRAKR
jgi:hypothetical protein